MAMYDCDIHPPGVVPDNMRESIRNRGDIDSARCMGFDEMGRHYWSVMEVANDSVNVAAARNRCFRIRRDPPLTFNRLFVAFPVRLRCTM